jgi:hypothetical protein
MVNAIMSHGEARPLEPLPVDWRERQPLRIEKADDNEMAVDEIDRDFAVLADLWSESEPADEDQLQRALHDAHRQSEVQERMTGTKKRPPGPPPSWRPGGTETAAGMMAEHWTEVDDRILDAIERDRHRPRTRELPE